MTNGYGTGEFSRLLAQRFEGVVAVDLSPNTIEVAKQRSQDYSNVDFQVADIMQWKFPSLYFDAIVSNLLATYYLLLITNY